jgi:hypothetical protein
MFLYSKRPLKPIKENVMSNEPSKEKVRNDREHEKSPDNHDLGKELIEPGGPIFDTPEGEDAKKKKEKDAA